MEIMRRERCPRCRVTLPAPYGAQTIRCPNCQSIVQFQLNRNGYFSPEVNGYLNGASDSTYNTRVGISAYSDYPKVNGYLNGASDNTYNTGMGISAYNDYPKVYGYVDGASDDTYKSGLGISAYSDHRRPGKIRPLQISTQMLPPPVSGPKRAVLCGVSCKDHAKSLKGSVNDVQSMRYLLVERVGFPSASVLVLTEEEKDQSRIPTKSNIRAALRWLVQGCQAGDSLVLYYSGHGSRVRDKHGDEIDGHDEALCPVDFETEGKILDDEINATIVRPLTRGATLHAIIDTCFSGTFLDLPYMCRMNREGNYEWKDHFPYAAYKGTAGGLAISISACDDHQNGHDTTYFTGTATGALTNNFIKTLEYEPRLTYGRLLMAMRNSIHKAPNGPGPNGTFRTDLLQEPQLSSSAKFDINQRFIS